MRLVVLAVGKIKDAWAKGGCDEFEKRIRRHLPLEIVELKEGADLTRHLPERHHVIALDERGKEPTSADLGARLARFMGSGVPGVVFLIGGADGHSDAVRARADELLALSRLTLPHRLARLLLLEQLYRALSIVRGEPYHRA